MNAAIPNLDQNILQALDEEMGDRLAIVPDAKHHAGTLNSRALGRDKRDASEDDLDKTEFKQISALHEKLVENIKKAMFEAKESIRLAEKFASLGSKENSVEEREKLLGQADLPNFGQAFAALLESPQGTIKEAIVLISLIGLQAGSEQLNYLKEKIAERTRIFDTFDPEKFSLTQGQQTSAVSGLNQGQGVEILTELKKKNQGLIESQQKALGELGQSSKLLEEESRGLTVAISSQDDDIGAYELELEALSKELKELEFEENTLVKTA